MLEPPLQLEKSSNRQARAMNSASRASVALEALGSNHAVRATWLLSSKQMLAVRRARLLSLRSARAFSSHSSAH
ncbi:hypothetical protein STIAU_8052 [Stigmatella aurantiaca DW4/3-1]|uniref:Uncharacterized protein n=1 Tax=Stigmatella aurantiaca (strain DW4/3-1) TaxID=378806 RepID=Q09BY6_STIAD|nr:hypothetical protein STIAU_8052 [Stigmatella aurantiaca DW4/3-1]